MGQAETIIGQQAADNWSTEYGPHLEKCKGCPCVLDRIMSALLDAALQQVRGQETEAELALPLEVEELNSVNDLRCTLSIRTDIQGDVVQRGHHNQKNFRARFRPGNALAATI